MFIDLYNRGLIPASIAVIRRRKQRHNVLLMAFTVPLHHQLMCSRDQFQIIPMIKLLADIQSKGEPRASRRHIKPAPLIRIGPQ